LTHLESTPRFETGYCTFDFTRVASLVYRSATVLKSNTLKSFYTFPDMSASQKKSAADAALDLEQQFIMRLPPVKLDPLIRKKDVI